MIRATDTRQPHMQTSCMSSAEPVSIRRL